MANDMICTGSGFPLWQRGIEGDFPNDPSLKIPPNPPLPKGGIRSPERNFLLRRVASGALALAAVCCFTAATALGLCADDAVQVGGTICVDKYEASVWSKPPGGIERGTQYGVAGEDYPCNRNGQNCDQIYAASISGELPSGYASWFQAQQACANAGKRLLTNAEWQLAANGTPDTAGSDNGETDCHTDNVPMIEQTVGTGSRPGCVSRWGVYDMIGNAGEWVADWAPTSSACTGWGDFSDDPMCFAGADPLPKSLGVLLRGGTFLDNEAAGPLTIFVGGPIFGGQVIGFRCVRPAS